MFLILILVATLIVYYILKVKNGYWKRRGVPGPEPKLLVGNIGASFLMKKSIGEIISDFYNDFPNAPFIGMFRAATPTLVIRDPEVIKDITVKHFNLFHDNDIDILIEHDPLMGRNPFFLNGDHWKLVRQQLTPCFTSQKMKQIYPLMEEQCKQLIKFIGNTPECTNGAGFEAKELCIKYTLNNVASCAFGLEGKCFEQNNSEFREIARQFLTPGSWSMFKLFLLTILPWLSKVVPIKFVPKEIDEKLTHIVGETLKYREEHGIVRQDFLHFMNQLKQTSKGYEFTDIDIVAHAAGFFIDGYETSSTVMSFIFFELATNPDVQAKLREEVNEKFDELGEGEEGLSYETIDKGTPYLEAVFMENHRKHPALFVLSKRSTGTYTYTAKPSDGLSKPTVEIEPGTSIILPIHSLQNDPRFYEDPDSFKPERFLDANKDKLVKYAYLPFGEGPRACLGQRFGVIQVKVGLAWIIRNFEITLNSKTKQPFKYDAVNFLVTPIGGLWVNFKKIRH